MDFWRVDDVGDRDRSRRGEIELTGIDGQHRRDWDGARASVDGEHLPGPMALDGAAHGDCGSAGSFVERAAVEIPTGTHNEIATAVEMGNWRVVWAQAAADSACRRERYRKVFDVAVGDYRDVAAGAQHTL